MTKVHLDFIEKLDTYPRRYIYMISHDLGRRLLDFIGEDKFKLLLDSRVLLYSHPRELNCISDNSYKLHPAAKSLEGFLKKLINGKGLKQNTDDQIGEVFGKKDSKVRKKIKDKRLIAKTKTVWDYCRNDIMHYSEPTTKRSKSVFKEMDLYENIIELIHDLYTDFYGKTEPDKEIEEGLKKHMSSRRKKKK